MVIISSSDLLLNFPQVVFRKLNSSAAVIEDMIGVRIVRVVQKLCAGLDCPLQFCDEVISLDKSATSTYSTARLSFVTPRHARTATCQCDGTSPTQTHSVVFCSLVKLRVLTGMCVVAFRC